MGASRRPFEVSLLLGLLVVSSVAGRDRCRIVQGTSVSRSDDLEIHAGGLVVPPGGPGGAFALTRVGPGRLQLAYFLAFKHGLCQGGRSECEEEAMVENRTGESKQTLTIDDKRLEVGYRVEVDGRSNARETLTVNGKAVEVKNGRVFL